MGFGSVLLLCWVGSHITDNFVRIAGISYESLWYKFPIDLQKFMRLIIADAHRPVVFQGLGIIDLNFVAFTKVSNLRPLMFDSYL